MKNERPKYELRLRNSSTNYSRSRNEANKDKNKSFSSKMTNSAIVCVLILIVVSLFKMSGNETAEGILKKLDGLISSQMDINQTVDNVVGFVTSTVSKLTGKEISVSGTPVKFTSPVMNGTLSQDFVDTVHPVFNTVVKPTGIKIATTPSAYIYSSCDGTVSNIIDNADGTKRVVVTYDKKTNVVYDGLTNVYVKKDEAVDQKQIIGIMPEGTAPVLSYEVWVDNEAQNPMSYIGAINQDEQK